MAFKKVLRSVSTLREELGKKLPEKALQSQLQSRGTDNSSLVKRNNHVIYCDLCCLRQCWTSVFAWINHLSRMMPFFPDSWLTTPTTFSIVFNEDWNCSAVKIIMEFVLIFEVWRNKSEAPSNISDSEVPLPRYMPRGDRNCGFVI